MSASAGYELVITLLLQEVSIAAVVVSPMENNTVCTGGVFIEKNL